MTARPGRSRSLTEMGERRRPESPLAPPLRIRDGMQVYCGGALASVRACVSVWPDGVTQVSLMVDPPLIACRMFISEAGDDTGWLLTLVMTSPGTSPTAAAGVRQSDPSTSVPELTGATWVGTPACWLLARQLLVAGWSAPNADCACFSCCNWASGLVAVLCVPFLPPGTSTP